MYYGPYPAFVASLRYAIEPLRVSPLRASIGRMGAGLMPGIERRLSLRRQILARDGNACFVCGLPMRFKGLGGAHDRSPDVATFEHIVETVNGGRWTISNLAHSHLPCNVARSRLNLFLKRFGERAGSPKDKWLMPTWPAMPMAETDA